jgi:hypothetical protein
MCDIYSMMSTKQKPRSSFANKRAPILVKSALVKVDFLLLLARKRTVDDAVTEAAGSPWRLHPRATKGDSSGTRKLLFSHNGDVLGECDNNIFVLAETEVVANNIICIASDLVWFRMVLLNTFEIPCYNVGTDTTSEITVTSRT